MGQLDKLETALDDSLNKKAPFKIPANGRKSLAGALWWIALVFGVLELWAAWDLWQLGRFAERFVDYANTLTIAYGGGVMSQNLGFMYYLAILGMIASGILLLLATPGLKAMRKAGWNLVFYSLLLSVVYGVVRMFSNVGGGFDDLLWSLVGTTIGAYFLFQVRDHFVMAKSGAHKAAVDAKHTAKEK